MLDTLSSTGIVGITQICLFFMQSALSGFTWVEATLSRNKNQRMFSSFISAHRLFGLLYSNQVTKLTTVHSFVIDKS